MEHIGTQQLAGTARLKRSLCIAPTSSHVPRKGPNRALAAYMPDADQAVIRNPLALSR